MDSQEDREAGYQLLTCIRYDPSLLPLDSNNETDGSPSPFLLLRFHVDRLLDAAALHGWPAVKVAVSIGTIATACWRVVADACTDAPLKIRLLVDQVGIITATSSLVGPLASGPVIGPDFDPINCVGSSLGPLYDVYIDSQPSPTSLFTSSKTTRRFVYDSARARSVGASGSNSSPNDILLHNESGMILETTIFNVAFHRHSRWLTPSVSTGCLPGVLRRWLLEQGRIHEDTAGELTLASVRHGDWVLLSNGVAGCRLGRIILSTPLI